MNTGRKTTGHAAAVITLGSIVGCGGVLRIPESEKAGPSVAFSSSSGAAPETGGVATATVVLSAPGAGIADEITVDVVDAALGTATPGTDYTAFAPRRVTFPAGSLDGASQEVTLNCIADNLVEGADETVVLALQGVAGATISGAGQHTVVIEDAQAATVQFTQGTTMTADESASLYPLTVELDLPAGSVLAFDIDLVASDDGTGDATSGSDYAAFAPQAVSFPAASPDGTTVDLEVQVIDDGDSEGNEFLAIALSGADLAHVSGGGSTRHVLSITDDEPAGSFFMASSGVTGTETHHASGDGIGLGSEVDGLGPNVGTVVIVRNAGGASMRLGTPVLGGADPNDFSIEVAGASSPDASGLGAPAAGPPRDVATPFLRRAALPAGEEDPLPGVALLMDEAAVRGLDGIDSVHMHGVPLPGLGDVTLALQRRPLPIAADAVLSVDGAPVTGGPRAMLSDLSVWSGSAVEIPGSTAFILLGPQGPEGRVELPFGIGRTIHVTTERPPTAEGDPARVRIVHEADLAEFPAFDRPALCGGTALVPGDDLDVDIDPMVMGSPPTSGLVAPANCRLAIETDYQLFQKFGSSSGLTSYVTGLVAAVSDVYMRDVQTTLSIAYLGVHTTAGDPWSTPDGGGNTASMLNEFRAAWNASGWPATADLAHFLSGASLGGGIAYIDVLCNQSFGYGVSANLNGNLDWNTWTGSAGSFTWDFVVLAHELGHNFGAEHTHNYCPPLDACYDNCNGSTSCSQGTLMSYCHLCGGLDNIDIDFHPNIANVMRQNVEASCLGDASMAPGDQVTYRVRFAPDSGAGSKAATLTFDHDAQNAPDPFVLNLTGDAQ